MLMIYSVVIWSIRLEALNEKRPGVVQMVKLADKEREILEVITFLLDYSLMSSILLLRNY